MTNHEQNIAVAEWMGYRTNQTSGLVCEYGLDMRNQNNWKKYPDYGKDLNSMHEVETKLPPKMWRYYSDKLMIAVRDSDLTLNGSNIEARYKSAHATASQRCEALLKTIGKWKD